MDYQALNAELTADPLGRGYAAMSDAEAADNLNTVYRERNRDAMSASEVYNAVDETEWLALSDTQRQEVWNILHLGIVNPFGLEATRFLAIFGPSTTITTLQALRVENISRAQELGLGWVTTGDVQKARAL